MGWYVKCDRLDKVIEYPTTAMNKKIKPVKGKTGIYCKCGHWTDADTCRHLVFWADKKDNGGDKE